MPNSARVNCTNENFRFMKSTLSSERRNKEKENVSKKRKTHRKSKLVVDKENCIKQCDKIPSPIELPVQNSESNSPRSDKTDVNQEVQYEHLVEARKLCRDLESQIEQLKLCQLDFRDQMGKNMPQRSCPVGGIEPSSPEIHSNVNFANALSTQLEKSVFDITEGNNKCPSVYMECQPCPANEDPTSIIKNLVKENEKYKRKVLKLQSQLKLVKKQEVYQKSPEIFSDELNYYNADVIGEGNSTVVYSGWYNGKNVAVKKLIKLSLVGTSSDQSYMLAEAQILLPLVHKNLVRLVGVSITAMEPLIISELITGKSLQDFLKPRFSGTKLKPASYFRIARDVSHGLAYLHNQKPPVLHLNLRPSNVLIHSSGLAKLADYGFSKIKLQCGLGSTTNLMYVAPELLGSPAKLTTKADVYAFAVLLLEMSGGHVVMDGTHATEAFSMLQNKGRMRIPTSLPCSFQKLITKCCATSYLQRPTFKEILVELETMMLPQDWLLDMDVDGVQRVSTSEMTCKYSIPQTKLGNQYYDEKVDILIEPDRIAEGNGLNTHRSLCSGTTTSCIGYKSYHPECNKSTVYKVKDNVDRRTMGDDHPTRSHHSDLACSRSSRYSKFDDKYLAFVGDANEKRGNVDPSSAPVVNPLLRNNAPNLEKLYAEMLEGHHVVENAKRLLASTNHVMHHTFRHSEVGL